MNTINKISNKAIGLKKTIDKIITNELSKLGYYYDKRYTKWGLHAFYKVVDGFSIGLELSKGNYENSLNASLTTSAPPPNEYSTKNIYYILDNSYKEPMFTSQQELEDILKDVLKLFIERGQGWVEEHALKSFDPIAIYDERIDLFFNKYNYSRISIDENLLAGGRIVYSNGNKKVIFEHHWAVAGITCLINVNGAEENLGKYIDEHKDFSYVGYGFKDRDEYIMSIEKLLKYIEQSRLID